MQIMSQDVVVNPVGVSPSVELLVTLNLKVQNYKIPTINICFMFLNCISSQVQCYHVLVRD